MAKAKAEPALPDHKKVLDIARGLSPYDIVPTRNYSREERYGEIERARSYAAAVLEQAIVHEYGEDNNMVFDEDLVFDVEATANLNFIKNAITKAANAARFK